MQTGTIIGLLLALTSTTLISLAYLREHDAAAALPPLCLRRPVHSLMLLLKSRAWLGGFAMETGGFALYAGALALAPLALVQSVAAGGIGVLAVATARLAHRRVTHRERVGASLAVLGLALLAISLSGGSAQSAAGALGPIVLWLAITAAVALLVLGATRAFLQRGVGDGIAGGLFFAIGDISTKLFTQGGSRFLFAIPLIVGYLLGTSLLQIGYQSASALTVAGLATLITNAVPIAAGAVVLGEHVPSGILGALRIIAFVAVTAGAAVLARPDPRSSPGAQAQARTSEQEPGVARPANP